MSQVLGMRLIRKAHLAPGQHECAYMSFKPFERDGTWIELLLSDPAKVSLIPSLFNTLWAVLVRPCCLCLLPSFVRLSMSSHALFHGTWFVGAGPELQGIC